jgi:hypothetical protein
MTRVDEVYAAFVAANPVPDVTSLDTDRLPADRFITTIERIPDMTNITEIHDLDTDRGAGPQVPPPWWRRPSFVAAAAFVAVLLIGAVWLITLAGDEDVEPASPLEDAESEALEAVELFHTSIETGDIETVLELSHPSAAGPREEAMWRMNSVMAAHGMGLDVHGCSAEAQSPTWVDVRCDVTLGDPVAEALGKADVVFPYDYVDGLVVWQPWEGADSEVNRVTSEYLQAFHPDVYEAACAPSAYDPTEVTISHGLALTGECAETTAPLLEDIAQWVRDGRPDA